MRYFGNTYQYYAVVSCDDFKKKTLKGVISKYFNNSYFRSGFFTGEGGGDFSG